MLNWLEPADIPVPAALQAVVGGNPLVATVLARRGILSPAAALAFLDPRRYTPASPEDFPGLAAASRRIENAIAAGERIWVWGDFDVDGQTSTTLLVSTLRSLGAEPRFHIPVRARESHGVNLPHLREILSQGADLMITCDTGIAAQEALAFAQESGLEVIVTDHHALEGPLPPALACITPRLLPPGHPMSSLPGVGVAYKLAEALFRRAGRPDEVERLLDLAALGIVADVALQTGDARWLLQNGLLALRQAERTGLKAVMELAEVNPAWLSEEHIGFALAPRLNALGRLDDANPAVELLTTRDAGRAHVLATHLEGLNARRQLLTSQVLKGALAQIERDPSLLDSPILVLSHPEWPAGVVGIVASQMAERFNRPTLLLSAPPGQPARGSARSVEGVDITACIAAQREMLISFGGHPMAAGLAVDPGRIPALRRGLSRAVQKATQAAGALPVRALQLDGYLELSDLSLELVEDLERLAPFGPGNLPLALVTRDLAVTSTVEIGREKEHLQLIVEDRAGNAQKVLWWGGAGWPQPQGRFDLACKLRTSNFRGQRDLQVEWIDFRPVEEEAISLRSTQREIVDHRPAAHPRPILDALLAQGNLALWCEGEAASKLDGQDRNALQPAPILVIWTTPPGPAELRSALERVRPVKVILFAVDPEAAGAEYFLKRLAGLVKYALSNQTQASLAQLAAATAQRESTVRTGLAWMQAKGMVSVDYLEGQLRFTAGAGQNPAGVAALLAQLKTALDETAAYRRYFRSTAAESLFD